MKIRICDRPSCVNCVVFGNKDVHCVQEYYLLFSTILSKYAMYEHLVYSKSTLETSLK